MSRYDVSGGSRKGGECERGSPPRTENFGKLWCRRSVFQVCFRSKCRVSNLILKASLTYFMQYFASILAYTGAVAGIQRKRKAMILARVGGALQLWLAIHLGVSRSLYKISRLR